MLRNETHLRAAQREADNYPREVHADGRSWQFWSLSAVGNSRRPVAWYTDGAQFMLFDVNGTPAESDGHDVAHDARCWDEARPQGGLRMADEKLPSRRHPGRQHPLFPEQPDNLRLPAAVKARLLAEYRGRRVVAGTVGSEAWVTEVRELGESQLRARRLRGELRGER